MTTTHTDENELFRVREYERLVDALWGCQAFANGHHERAYVVRWPYVDEDSAWRCGYAVTTMIGLRVLHIDESQIVDYREPERMQRRTVVA